LGANHPADKSTNDRSGHAEQWNVELYFEMGAIAATLDLTLARFALREGVTDNAAGGSTDKEARQGVPMVAG